MTVLKNVTPVYTGPSSAGEILAPTIDVGLGVPATMAGTFNTGGVYGGDSLASTTAYQGYRVAQVIDFSANTRVGWALAFTNTLDRNATDTFANGGLRIVFEDGSGNWASFHVYGSDYFPFGTTSDGAFGGYGGFGNLSVRWYLDKTRTPDQSSGTLDWSNIAAHEIHFLPRSSGRMGLACGNFITCGDPIHTGVTSTLYSDITTAYSNTTGGTPYLWFVSRKTAPSVSGSPQDIYTAMLGLEIGDGSTHTEAYIDGQNLFMWNTPEGYEVGGDQPGYPGLLLGSPRVLKINQSATDIVNVTDAVFGSYYGWAVEVTGSTAAICVFNVCQFWRSEAFTVRHGVYNDCQFYEPSSPLLVDTDSVLLDCSVFDATTTGLKITSGAGVYSDLKFRSNNPTATADIEVGDGGAGIYELLNITVPAGYVLKLRNNSATNAVEYLIPVGITYTTSTAGGGITVVNPIVTATGSITDIVPGSRVQVINETKSTKPYNDVPGTSYTDNYTEGTTYEVGDVITVKITQQSGVTAKKEFTQSTIATASGWTILAAQQDDDVYNSFGIDGSLQTGKFSADYANDEADLILPNDFLFSEFYAWWVHNLTTSQGIDEFFGGITAIDEANFRINVSTLNAYIDNSTATNVVQLDNRRIYRSDDAYPVRNPTSGGGGVDVVWRDKILVATVGDGPLTPAQESLLSNAAAAYDPVTGTNKSNIKYVNDVEVKGVGTIENPWNPV